MRLYAFLIAIFLHLAVLGQAAQHPVGDWSPTNPKDQQEWLADIAQRVDRSPENLHPVLKECKYLIESSPRLNMLFHGMIQEVPRTAPFTHELNGHPEIRDPMHLLQIINYLLTTAPSYNERKNRMSFVGLPITVLLNWPMATHSGFAAFLDPDVNMMIQKIITVWGAYLQSPNSSYILGNKSTDWFGPTAMKDMAYVGNVGKTNYTVDELFVTNPSHPHRGFKSWDDFFTRHFRPGIRPTAAPDNDSVIVSACESKPYNLVRNAKAHDQFWIKQNAYSVLDMLNGDPLAHQFVNGTVYQAFLSALSYHRWHAPVSGRIKKAFVVNGTYYSSPLSIDIDSQQSNHSYIQGQNIAQAQEYLTSVATRAVVFIEADNPAIGTMAFIGVGMTEVSTCDITVNEGDYVRKGDDLGMFHYGGSTHVLMFRGGVNVSGFPKPGGKHNVPVRSQLAVVQ